MLLDCFAFATLLVWDGRISSATGLRSSGGIPDLDSRQNLEPKRSMVPPASPSENPCALSEIASTNDMTALDRVLEYPDEANALSNGVFYEYRSSQEGKQPTRCRVKRCDACSTTVNLGKGISLHAFEDHRGSKACKTKQATALSLKSQPKISNIFKRTAPVSVVTETAQPSAERLEQTEPVGTG